jgi:hypothetical protein
MEAALARVNRAHDNRAAAKLGVWTSAPNREWLTGGEDESCVMDEL